MLREPLPDTEIISQIVAKIQRAPPEIPKWQIGDDRSGKYAAIPTTRIGEYRATLNNLPTLVLHARIIDWTVAKSIADGILVG